ncbi:hypothetical protein FDH38_gp026 [Dinoroseobacter phage vB_DshS-R5C]|uniref:Uncharacterized protein n=1 Tax=Dinoroseobacter phage vB_DshS-R5C TaxID=1965368 RepID=A0A1V0DY71_9CAUD|nr:hypothetical protein FDH38_gp026 [Dinoroseobacter phage vB_DshS-R5C]ARB06080.1 hypothetical protein vBDshSR5C_26 [Dinoroseobacter phage vB_DshS-R5C]
MAHSTEVRDEKLRETRQTLNNLNICLRELAEMGVEVEIGEDSIMSIGQHPGTVQLNMIARARL